MLKTVVICILVDLAVLAGLMGLAEWLAYRAVDSRRTIHPLPRR